MNFDWLTVILGQAVRHLLTAAAALLTAYGVTADQTNAAIGPVTSIIVSLILFALSQIWAAFSKKVAFETPVPFR